MRYLKLYERFIRENNTQTPSQAPSTTQTPGQAPPMPTEKPGQRFEFEKTKLYSLVVEKIKTELGDPEFQSLNVWSDFVEKVEMSKKDDVEVLFKEGMDKIIEENWADLVQAMLDNKFLSRDEAERAKNMVTVEVAGPAPEISTTKPNQRPVNENLDNDRLKKLAQDALKNAAILSAMAAGVKIFFLLTEKGLEAGRKGFEYINEAGLPPVIIGVILILIYLAFFKKVKMNDANVEEIGDNEPPLEK